ncbi:MAG: alpha/beta fold hydrolase [Lysobacterales bacterium]
MNQPARLSACLALLLFAFFPPCEAGESTLINNVSYSSVTALGYTEANAKLVYGTDNPELQYGLLWLPANMAPVEKAPLIVLIHGGCWLNQFDIKHTFPLSSALAEAGYAVWSLEYRRTGDAGGGWPGSFNDIKQGLTYTTKLQDYPVDTDRMLIMGHSAGGHLALLAAGESDGLQAVIGLAAITNIIEYSRGKNSCQTATIGFMGGEYESNPAAYQAANPAGKPTHGNTVLLQGDIDSIVPSVQASLQGATTEVYEGAGHFDWVHPGSGAFTLLLSTLESLLEQ